MRQDAYPELTQVNRSGHQPVEAQTKQTDADKGGAQVNYFDHELKSNNFIVNGHLLSAGFEAFLVFPVLAK